MDTMNTTQKVQNMSWTCGMNTVVILATIGGGWIGNWIIELLQLIATS
jgi:hypothetical protein